MKTRARGLGRGLESLIPLPADGGAPGQLVAIDQVRPSSEQMRRRFPADAMRELTDSVREHGVLQPVVVRRVEGGFELIAGERRWRAAKAAGLARIPVTIRPEAGERDALLLGLVENLQRENLDPIEEARGIQRLIEVFGLTHEQAAQRLGKHRVAVTQALGLLRLAPAVSSAVSAGSISAGHARALASLPDPEAQERGLRVVLARQLSVRQAERWARTYAPPQRPRRHSEPAGGPAPDPLVERLREALGAPVTITGTAHGRLTIEFSSRRQLEEIAARLTAGA